MGAQQAAGMALLLLGTVVVAMGPQRTGRAWHRMLSRAERLTLLRPSAPIPQGRPIEIIARDAYRLGRQFRYEPRGLSFARFEAHRLAYDAVLGEACLALGVEHLLGVLKPGLDLDRERRRVEMMLYQAGLPLDDAA